MLIKVLIKIIKLIDSPLRRSTMIVLWIEVFMHEVAQIELILRSTNIHQLLFFEIMVH